jgi:hypothetical protein
MNGGEGVNQCTVCEHAEADHVMAQNAVEFKRRGDFCMKCQRACRGAQR